MKLRSTLFVFVVAMALPGAASASTTLGTIVAPSMASTANCAAVPAGEVAIFGQVPGANAVPAGGGMVTSWSVNATGDGSGTETLYVLAPSGAGYTVEGVDTEAIPSVIPAGGTVTFTINDPILAASGDTFALSSTGAGPINCGWLEGSTPASDEVFLEAISATATVGQTIVPEAVPPTDATEIPQGLLNLEVTLAPGSEDVAVTTSAGPGNAIVGDEALLSSTVTNNGPFAGPTTFSDAVQADLKIDAATTNDGTCAVAGQVVTCSFANLAVGASVPVEIAVTPSSAQSYENTVSVADATGVTDPNPANNAASATLVVGAATITPSLATRECVSTNVKGLSEKVVKRLLPSFGCKLGKIKKASSKTVAKGDVISLKPGSGAHAPGTKVTLTVSTGKPKSKHKH